MIMTVTRRFSHRSMRVLLYLQLLLPFGSGLTTTAKVIKLMSDLPTPCWVLDLQAIQLLTKTTTTTMPPSFMLSTGQDCVLVPTLDSESTRPALQRPEALSITNGACFMHTTVLRSRNTNNVDDADDPIFLAELDSPSWFNTGMLVLGLNNHHVGSYYWARSAGAGAAMEAPGIQIMTTNDNVNGNCILQWASAQGPRDCNSNDGKRSEWVNFLRPGDTVQLMPPPHDDGDTPLSSLLLLQPSADNPSPPALSLPVYGISSQGRPLGSEPQVICTYQIQIIA